MIKEKPDEIIFVTSNKGKVATANKYLKTTRFKTIEYDIEEIRSDDIKEIAEDKVKKAYKLIGKPCISQDSGFFVEELNGFPRAYVNFSLNTIGIEGILKLMENVENRKCSFKECLTYYDGKKLLFFEGYHEGTVSTEIRGIDDKNKWSDLWYIFVPYGHNKTLAEMSPEERDNRDINNFNYSSFLKFKEYINLKI